MLAGSSAARHYGYSSARVKAMESRLLSGKALQDMMEAKDIGTMLSMLFQGDYREELEEYGGLDIKSEHIDFALSKNLAKSVEKLVSISPSTEKNLMRAIVGKWDLYNVKVCLEAKDRRQPYEVIARYIIDYGIYDAQAVKEIMREESVEGMLNKFMLNSPYRAILREALEEYKRTRSSADAIAAVDRLYYKMLGNVIIGLRAVDNSSARIVKMDIDLKNMLLLIKAKRVGAKFSEIANGVIAQGNMPVNELESIYSNSKDIEAMAAQFKQYDLKDALESYRSGKPGKLLSFEISLRNNVFMQSRRMLNHSMLSFGAMLAYAYMKEIEIFTLRIIINSRLYGLGREDTAKLINDSTRKPIISMVG